MPSKGIILCIRQYRLVEVEQLPGRRRTNKNHKLGGAWYVHFALQPYQSSTKTSSDTFPNLFPQTARFPLSPNGFLGVVIFVPLAPLLSLIWLPKSPTRPPTALPLPSTYFPAAPTCLPA